MSGIGDNFMAFVNGPTATKTKVNADEAGTPYDRSKNLGKHLHPPGERAAAKAAKAKDESEPVDNAAEESAEPAQAAIGDRWKERVNGKITPRRPGDPMVKDLTKNPPQGTRG